MTLDGLSDDMDRSGFWDWAMKMLVRLLRIVAAMTRTGGAE